MAIFIFFFCLPNLIFSDDVDVKLKELNQNLDDLRKKMINEEMEAQPLLIDDWKEYVEGINQTEQDEKKIEQIKKDIQHLETIKARESKN